MTKTSRAAGAAPAVSVLMAVYNGESHVQEAIDGILAQTFRDLEFVIVDDGSTDDTRRILDGYRDSRIVRLHHPQNRGLIAALNTGLAAARGDLVARQDADDVSFPDRLQAQVDFLGSRPDVGLLGSGSVFEAEVGGARKMRRVEEDPRRLAWILLFWCPLQHSSIMFRRKIIQDLGGYGKDDLFVEDFALWSKVIRSSTVAIVPQVLITRRRPPESITARYHVEMGRAARRVSLDNLRWASSASVSDEHLDALQAFVSNRTLSLPDALALDSRGVRSTAVRVLDGFWSRMGFGPGDHAEFRKWALGWMGGALLKRSHKLLAKSTTATGPEKREGAKLARALALDAVRMSPGVLSSRLGASVALRALMSRA